MPGRDPLPGENETGHSGLRDGTRYHSRIVRGQLASPYPPEGRVQVNTSEIYSTRDATVPVLWMTQQGRRTAWGRYMPIGNERVHVAYRNDDTPVILGYDGTANEDPDKVGWPIFKKFQENAVSAFSVFRELKPGEFDFKSGGDAYIHGSAGGTLLLTGGQTLIKLDKNSYRQTAKASEYNFTSETSQFRIGTVFRKEIPTDLADSPLAQGIYKEFLVDINQALPSGTPSIQSKARLHFGDIIETPANIPEVGPKGVPLRARISLGDAGNALEIFKLEIDQMGNVVWEQANNPAATTDMTIGGMNIAIDGATGNFHIIMTGIPTVSVAIANHLQTLWTQLVSKLTAFDEHVHPTGVGPSGPPAPKIAAPAWDNKINSTKLNIPDL